MIPGREWLNHIKQLKKEILAFSPLGLLVIEDNLGIHVHWKPDLGSCKNQC
jgi:hypothetical protein